jgi:hypothetical protein
VTLSLGSAIEIEIGDLVGDSLTENRYIDRKCIPGRRPVYLFFVLAS